MKLKEAEILVSNIIRWQLVLMGVVERDAVECIENITKYSLMDLIKANSLVGSSNKRKRGVAEYHRRKGHNVKGISTTTILDDRLIAAIYTAMHFEPANEIVALINDVGVGCVSAKYNTSSNSMEYEEES